MNESKTPEPPEMNTILKPNEPASRIDKINDKVLTDSVINKPNPHISSNEAKKIVQSQSDLEHRKNADKEEKSNLLDKKAESNQNIKDHSDRSFNPAAIHDKNFTTKPVNSTNLAHASNIDNRRVDNNNNPKMMNFNPPKPPIQSKMPTKSQSIDLQNSQNSQDKSSGFLKTVQGVITTGNSEDSEDTMNNLRKTFAGIFGNTNL